MALSKEYTSEQLNFFRVCYVTTDVLADGLREIFKQEWDKVYKSTKGEWKDDSRSGTDFYNGGSPQNQKRNALFLATIKNGKRREWENFPHITQGRLSDTDFQNAIGKVDVAFQALRLTTEKNHGIKNQATFPTEQLLNTLKNLQEKENQRQVLADQLYKEVPSFCILPPEPAHDIGSRDCEVAKIAQLLKELKKANYNRLSYSYISGNPGSGKSQLAGLVAQRFFHEQVKEMPHASSFVMTINVASPDSLLESYTNFARQ